MEEFSRTQLLIGQEGLDKLKQAKIIIFGIGGVGGYVVEALARSGIGHLDIVDHDRVSVSNMNRQIIATHETVDRLKVDVMAERIHAINPFCQVGKYDMFFLPENKDLISLNQYDYIIDAVDTVTAKLLLVELAKQYQIPIISSMGTGNKMDPTQLKVADITQTSICPLARVMRRELKKRGIKHLKVVYSTETPIVSEKVIDETSHKQIPGSIAFVPSVAGLILAGEVIKDLLKTA